MRQSLRHPATLISFIALFASFAGGAVAAKLITGKQVKNGSLTGKDIKNNSLKKADVGTGAVGASELRNGSIGLADLSPAVQAALAKAGTAGPAGANGAPGATGPTGAQGAQGPSGQANVTKVTAFGGAFSLTNDSNSSTPQPTITGDGVKFTVADGNAKRANIIYTLPAPITINQVNEISYRTKANKTGALPYLSLILEDNNKHVTYDAQSQDAGDQDLDIGEFNSYAVTDGLVRYDDDCGDGIQDSSQADGCTPDGAANGPDLPGIGTNPVQGGTLAQLKAAFGTKTVKQIRIQVGFSGGDQTNLRALLTSLSLNGQTFVFGS